MRRPLNLFFFVSVLCVLFSCQKETSFELGQASRGSLQSSAGDCLPKNVSGTYKTSQALVDSNYIDVTVNVGQVGSYIIATDTLNGYWFRTTGNFTIAGSNTVRLKGFGTPSTAGLNNFTVRYDTTNCNVPVTVISSGGGSGGTSVFNLQGSPDTCMSSTLNGTYTQGTALTSSNNIVIQVNVTTAGTWTVTTNTVDGITFSGSGTFGAAGIQTITLNGSGNPIASGTQTFTVTAGSSSCTFVVTVAAGSGSTSSNDYFPLTQNSYWTYDIGTSGTDTLKTTVSGTTTFNSNIYQRLISVFQSGPPNDSSFYRKDNSTGFYYNYVDTSAFSGSGITFSQKALDILFLKNSLTTGATWNSDFNASVMGVPVIVRFKYTCANANVSVTINGNNFTNVYQVTLQAQIGAGGTFSDAGSPTDFYYAKGVGLIKIPNQVNGDKNIRYWQVF